MKLWLVTLQGMTFSVSGAAPHGKAYVVAETADRAILRLLSYVKGNDLGFPYQREVKCVELIADSQDRPDCGMRLFM